jgi:hypothetical protein
MLLFALAVVFKHRYVMARSDKLSRLKSLVLYYSCHFMHLKLEIICHGSFGWRCLIYGDLISSLFIYATIVTGVTILPCLIVLWETPSSQGRQQDEAGGGTERELFLMDFAGSFCTARGKPE